jgi:hypothetical protein
LFGGYILGVVVGLVRVLFLGVLFWGWRRRSRLWWGLVRFLLVLVKALVDFIVAEWRWCEREPLLGGMVE